MANGNNAKIIEMLTQAYWMEMETVMNYTACSINPDGIRADDIRKALAQDITEELTHAQQFGQRIKELYGSVPGSMAFKATQASLQPPRDNTDIVSVIKGVIEAEKGAIAHYKALIKLCDGDDYVTQDLAIQILKDEEGHKRLFEGYLKEYEKQ